MTTRRRNVATLALALALALSGAASAALAQVPVPTIPEMSRRNGMITRIMPINPNLPPDPKRDEWYDTRWGDPPNLNKHPNWYRNGGLYGLPWRATHTASVSPFFYGAPGQSTLTPDDHPIHGIRQLGRAVFHPFKPIGMYYDQGSFVPIFDLDPIVPGPGPWPWPFYRRLTSAGG